MIFDLYAKLERDKNNKKGYQIFPVLGFTDNRLDRIEIKNIDGIIKLSYTLKDGWQDSLGQKYLVSSSK